MDETQNKSVEQQVLEKIESLQATQTKLAEQLETVSQRSEELRKSFPFGEGAPHARKGEDPMTSRGYSYCRLFGVMQQKVAKEDAKVEIDLANRLQKSYVQMGDYVKASPNSILAPFSSGLLQTTLNETQLAREVEELVKAGVSGYSRETVKNLRERYWGVSKALSWQDELAGGALVAPPLMGELIDLLRNNEVFLAAGAKVIPMPPNGRITYPRQTGAATAYWVGESETITASEQTTGDLILQGKKLATLTKIPNELFRFASVNFEQFVREDLVRVMALKMDKSLLEAVGSAYEPKGLINYSGIQTHTASTTGSDGDTFEPEDVLKMIAKVEERNAVFKTFVMRPLMYAAICNRRADAVTAADGKGPFVFNLFRQVGDNMDVQRATSASLGGYPVFKSTQVSNVQAKGNGDDLTYILGGDFTDYVVALSGVIEFMLSGHTTDAFEKDQTWIRGIQYVDGGPRREASFIFCDDLVVA